MYKYRIMSGMEVPLDKSIVGRQLGKVAER